MIIGGANVSRSTHKAVEGKGWEPLGYIAFVAGASGLEATAKRRRSFADFCRRAERVMREYQKVPTYQPTYLPTYSFGQRSGFIDEQQRLDWNKIPRMPYFPRLFLVYSPEVAELGDVFEVVEPNETERWGLIGPFSGKEMCTK